eukprot:COSAG02_NODE_1039_length_15040_cov_70.746737_4_plen_286_part_00
MALGPMMEEAGIVPCADPENEAFYDRLIERLKTEGASGAPVQMEQEEIKRVLTKCREVFMQQPPLLELNAPINICGDIHGQYPDLLRMFEFGRFPPESNYLFLGDYIDRGKQSLEAIMLLLCFKIKYPENFFLLRGNHEASQINRIYGFYDECKRRYNVKVWKLFNDCFNCLPFVGIVEEKIICMHGGLSPSLSNMDQLRQIRRCATELRSRQCLLRIRSVLARTMISQSPHRSCAQRARCPSAGRLRCQTKDCCATCYGRTQSPTRRAGARTIVAYRSPSELML